MGGHCCRWRSAKAACYRHPAGMTQPMWTRATPRSWLRDIPAADASTGAMGLPPDPEVNKPAQQILFPVWDSSLTPCAFIQNVMICLLLDRGTAEKNMDYIIIKHISFMTHSNSCVISIPENGANNSSAPLCTLNSLHAVKKKKQPLVPTCFCAQ